ncbi:MAG: hypothetical protein PHO83_09685 [Geobacteraceae bacterium]|nr:hypothetical protein [Geobacteraceae bacterium]
MKISLLLVAMLTVAGCAPYLSSAPFPLEVSDPISVRQCRLVGKYPGPYGYKFWGPPPVLGDFKYRTAVKAREAGATHIFWREDTRGYYGQTRVTGYAFDCTGIAMPKYYEDLEPY